MALVAVYPEQDRFFFLNSTLKPASISVQRRGSWVHFPFTFRLHFDAVFTGQVPKPRPFYHRRALPLLGIPIFSNDPIGREYIVFEYADVSDAQRFVVPQGGGNPPIFQRISFR